MCLAGLVITFIALQAWSIGATSDKRIIKTLNKAAQTGVLTDNSFPMSPYGHVGLNYDMFTDCIAMSTNLGTQDEPLMRRVAATPYVDFYRTTPLSPCTALVEALRDKTMRASVPYFRYWHGHQIYLRPLMANMSLARIHILNALLLYSAIGVFAVYLARWFGPIAAPLLLVPLALASNIATTAASTVHALTWIWAFVSLTLMLTRFENHEPTAPNTLVMAFACGCVAAFFDVLFSPPFAPVLMAFLAIHVGLNRGRAWRAVLGGGVVAFVWFAGFSLSWMSKWVFSSIVLGWATVKPYLFDAIKVRSFGDASVTGDQQSLFTATHAAFASLPDEVLIWSAVIALLMSGVALARGDHLKILVRLAALLSPLVIPIVWVEVLRDHSIGHPSFAGRSFVLFAVIPLLAAWSAWRMTTPAWLARRSVKA